MDLQQLLTKLEANEELKAALPVIQALVDSEATAKAQVGQLTRQIEVSNVAAKTGANAQVLLDLLPQELKLNVDGTVQGSDGKIQPLADYVKADSKLSLYQASIFGTQAQSPATVPAATIPGAILSGRSQSNEAVSPTAQVLKQVQQTQTANAESVLNRFNK